LLYASNRGHDSIAVFAIGRLTPIAWEPTRGRKRRFFALDPTGAVPYAANEAGDTFVPFRVDPETGRLTATGAVVRTASPACIVLAGA
jgi:6-phosphogluconolactonase (cycloisomerase 2 family)